MSSLKKQPAEACHRPAGLEYFADGNAARVLIPRQVGNGHDVIKLRKNTVRGSDRCWLVQLIATRHSRLLTCSCCRRNGSAASLSTSFHVETKISTGSCPISSE